MIPMDRHQEGWGWGKEVNLASKLQEVQGLENGSGSKDSAAGVKP